MEITEFQDLIRRLYLERDTERGIEGTYFWFAEEVGELTRAIRRGHEGPALAGEFADVFAWLVSMASMLDVDLEAAVTEKYFKDGIAGHEKDKQGAEPDA